MVIAIDPGPKHTAIVQLDQIDYPSVSFRVAARSMLTFPDRDKLYNVFRVYAQQLDAIIVEDFLLDPSKAKAQSYSRFETVKIIERVVCQLENLKLTHLLVIQAPGLRYSARAFPQEHEQALYGGMPIDERKHLYSAYQHGRYFIGVNKRRGKPQVRSCVACGWLTNTSMAFCFNCDSTKFQTAT